MWRVTAAIDYLDPSPEVMVFDTECEATDWMTECADARVQHRTDHSPYRVTCAEAEAMRQEEMALMRLEWCE